MMNNQQFGNVPASRFKNLAEEIEDISKTKFGSHYDMKDHLEDISEKVEKVIEVNVQLQQKITKLGEAIAELANEIRESKGEIAEPVQAPASSMPRGIPPPPSLSFEEEDEEPMPEPGSGGRLVEQLKVLTDQNMELLKSLKNIDERLDKGSSKDRIAKALKKAGAI